MLQQQYNERPYMQGNYTYTLPSWTTYDDVWYSVSTHPAHTNSCHSSWCPLSNLCRQRSSPPQPSSLFHGSLCSWRLSFSRRLKRLWHCLHLCEPCALSPFIALTAMCWPAHLTVVAHSATCLFLLWLCSFDHALSNYMLTPPSAPHCFCGLCRHLVEVDRTAATKCSGLRLNSRSYDE